MKITLRNMTNPGRVDLRSLLVVLSVLLAGLFSLPLASAQPGGPQGEPPGVSIAVITEQDVNPPLSRNGRVEAVQSVDLRARVEGVLEEIRFKEGADVQKGDLLYVIEQAPYKAALQVAEAEIAKAEAALANARQFLKRLQSARKGAVAESDLEAAASAELQAKASLMEAEARRLQARLNLGYTHIRAPIAGRIGKSALTVGNLLGPASGVLARLVQLHPIRVVYSVSEDRVFNVRLESKGQNVEALNASFVPEIEMSNGVMYAHTGKIDFVDNQVDSGTGTVAIRTLFPNPDTLLLPGQFVKVVVRRNEAKRMPIVPQAAIMEDREGRFVFVVDASNTVLQRRIRTGASAGTGWAVEEGLQAGESVIVQGIQKARPGQIVRPIVAGQGGGK